MDERAFVIQQIGAKDSPERRRADEIYKYIIVPAVEDAGLKPYRADLDLTPGAITPKLISELLNARVVIADLTGRNPNVFYELGITHSFIRPLISIADSSSSLPFDAKDERVIELGEYSSSGLAFAQGQNAKDSLRESLRIVLDDGYVPPSPLSDVAANRSIDDLAPENPVAAEMAQMRETLEDIRMKVSQPRRTVAAVRTSEDIKALRNFVEARLDNLDENDLDALTTIATSTEHDGWVAHLVEEWDERHRPTRKVQEENGPGGYSDEPPF